jgi:hypothetical protein
MQVRYQTAPTAPKASTLPLTEIAKDLQVATNNSMSGHILLHVYEYC